jgi:hypothetical protein
LAKPHRAAAAGAMRLLFSDAGQAILPAAGFQAALSGLFITAQRRPKDFCRMVAGFKCIPSRLDV